MKAILKFDLPDERYEFERAVEAQRWQFFAHNLNEYIRKEMKWNEALTEGEYKVLDKLHKKLFELLEEERLSLDIE